MQRIFRVLKLHMLYSLFGKSDHLLLYRLYIFISFEQITYSNDER